MDFSGDMLVPRRVCDLFTGSKHIQAFFFPANQLETLGPYQTPTKRCWRRKRFIPFPENHSLGEFPVLHLGCVEIFHIFESWSVVENVTWDEFRYSIWIGNIFLQYYQIEPCLWRLLTLQLFRSGCSKCHETYLTDLPPQMPRKTTTEPNHSHLECLVQDLEIEHGANCATCSTTKKSSLSCWFFPRFSWVFG